MQIVIYTHTDFLDIFAIQQDHFISQNLTNVTIFSNTHHAFYKFPVITYDDSLPYANRVLQCIKQIENKDDFEYFFLIHDNDILLNIDIHTCELIITKLKEHNFARLDLNSVNFPHKPTYKVNDDITLGENDNFYTYSVGPSIWNYNSFKTILKNNKFFCYRTIEPAGTAFMVNNNFKTAHPLGLVKHVFANRHLLSFCYFLHITQRGQYIFDNNSSYTDYAKQLYIKYNITRPIMYW